MIANNEIQKKEIKQIIDKYENIVLTIHRSPDGDAFGSSLAFKQILEKYDKNKKIYLVVEDEIPSYVEKLKYKTKIYEKIEDLDINFEKTLLISLDTANKERLAINLEYFDKFIETMNIDHHISNHKYSKYNYVEDISSVSELVFSFLDLFSINLDEKIAECIYLGIINDTGNFRHSNTTKNTFIVASKLMDTKINISEIYFMIFSKSRKKTRAFGDAMVEFVEYDKYPFAYYYLSYEEIQKKGYQSEDIDGISELILTIDGIKLSLFIKEDEKGNIKGSIRSKEINVSKMAEELFGGGGHIKAAGFITNDSKTEVISKIEKYLEKYV